MEEVVCAITCFYGRKRKVERVMKCFQDQTFKGKSYHLLYNNSATDMELGDDYPNTILVNNHIDMLTQSTYNDTGSIFRDALFFVPVDATSVTFMDSDDLFLPNHIEEGVKGLTEARGLGMLAYKPTQSIFLYGEEVGKANNNHEPSIFVDYNYVDDKGFHKVPCSYHQKWLDSLIKEKKILIKDGPSTFVYDWSSNHGDFKISGLGDDKANFCKHRTFEQDFGDAILRPSEINEALKYGN